MAEGSEIGQTISELMQGRVLFDEPMSRHTSIGVGGPADILAFPEGIEELVRLISCLREERVAFMPIGNCTNLIVRDGGFRGAMISLRSLQGVDICPGAGDSVFIAAEAGVLLSHIVDLSVRESLSGIEFCAGIPGSVGGSVKMNAGAYGREMKDVIHSVTLFNGQGDMREVSRDGLPFSYRNLDIPAGTTITGTVLHLTRGDRGRIEERVAEILDMRRGKHPLEYRNAGSVFKNLPGYPAGQIIDEIGMKGTRVGDAQVSEKHGNFIVNLGQATAGDVISLIEIIRKKVLEQRGIALDTEVRIVGTGEKA